MIDYSYVQIEKAIRGKLVVPTRRSRFKGPVSTDTRTLAPGSLFIAIKGPHFDGHEFIEAAFAKGARLCVAEYASAHRIRRKDPDIIFVESTLQAMARLAAFHRREKKIPVIAVTGSCGKTTTKEMLAQLLSTRYRVLKSEGSENNIYGVTKTLLRLDDQEVAVVEIGTNQIGEIYHLARIVNPTHAVLTLIGNAHLSGFRSLQGVKREKLSLLEALPDKARVYLNAEDKNLTHERLKKMKVRRCGFSAGYDCYAARPHLMNNGSVFLLNGKTKVVLPLLGRHNIVNALLAIAAARDFKIKDAAMAEAFKNFEPIKGRLRHQEIRGIHWIDDSYNSNPSSLQAAIELFKSYPPEGRKILVLGDMLELGLRARAFHQEAGRSIAEYPFDLVLAVGELAKKFAEEAVFHGFDKKKIFVFGDSESAGRYLAGKLMPKDTVLLKASRGKHLEKVLEIFTSTPQQDPPS